MSAPAAPWPVELRVRDAGRAMEAAFDDGARFELPAALLRVMTTSAEARGHGGMSTFEPLALDASQVRITAVTPIGRYAVRIAFDDGHDTGLYTWEALHRIGRERADLEAKHRSLMADPTA